MECIACQLRKLDEEAAEEQAVKARARQVGAVGMMGVVAIAYWVFGANAVSVLALLVGAVLGWLLVLRNQQLAQKR